MAGNGGVIGRGGIAGKLVGPMPGCTAGGLANVGEPVGTGGETGKAGIAGAWPASLVLFNRTKLRLCGNRSAVAPVSRSTMFLAYGQAISVRSIRRWFEAAV
jgi:hypothetical protein